MKRYEHYCSWDGGGPADPEEDANGDWVRYDDAQSELAALRKDAERYRWLAARMLAADFDYTGERIQALVFEMPDGFQASADCDATIDAAILMAPGIGAA